MCLTSQSGPAPALAPWATAWPLGGLPGHRPHADTYIVQGVRHICRAKSGLGACGVPVRRCFGAQPFAMGGCSKARAKNLQTAGQTSGKDGKVRRSYLQSHSRTRGTHKWGRAEQSCRCPAQDLNRMIQPSWQNRFDFVRFLTTSYFLQQNRTILALPKEKISRSLHFISNSATV